MAKEAANKGKQGKASADDLIGDTSKRAKNVTSGKGSGAGNSKGAAAARGQGRQGAAVAAGRTTTRTGKGQGTVGERGAAKRQQKAADARAERGSGRFFFPPDDPERSKIRKALEKAVKPGGDPVSTKAFAGEHDFETWKVRLVARDMEGEKLLKLQRSGDSGGVLLMMPPKKK